MPTIKCSTEHWGKERCQETWGKERCQERGDQGKYDLAQDRVIRWPTKDMYPNRDLD
jgi:hypothetical protein